MPSTSPRSPSTTTVLSECGRAAHVAVLAAARIGTGAWLTPAMDEQVAAELCGLEPEAEETLYMLKVGMPKVTADVRQQR